MEMTLRWYGSKFDTVTLKQIRQIPGVTGVITTLYDTTAGGGVEQGAYTRIEGGSSGGGAAYSGNREREYSRCDQDRRCLSVSSI